MHIVINSFNSTRHHRFHDYLLFAALHVGSSVSLYPESYGSLTTYNRQNSQSAGGGSLSSLQNTLVQCGHLSHAESLKENKSRKQIEGLLKEKKRLVKKHSIWLQKAGDEFKNVNKDTRIPSHHLGTEGRSSVSTVSTEGVSLPANQQRDMDVKSGLVSDEHRARVPSWKMGNGEPIPKVKELIRPEAHSSQPYEQQLAAHLTIAQVEANPFRDSKMDKLPKTNQVNAPFSFINSGLKRGEAHEDKDIKISKRNKVYFIFVLA